MYMLLVTWYTLGALPWLSELSVAPQCCAVVETTSGGTSRGPCPGHMHQWAANDHAADWGLAGLPPCRSVTTTLHMTAQYGLPGLWE